LCSRRPGWHAFLWFYLPKIGDIRGIPGSRRGIRVAYAHRSTYSWGEPGGSTRLPRISRLTCKLVLIRVGELTPGHWPAGFRAENAKSIRAGSWQMVGELLLILNRNPENRLVHHHLACVRASIAASGICQSPYRSYVPKDVLLSLIPPLVVPDQTSQIEFH
jgi:hypothetical protein